MAGLQARNWLTIFSGGYPGEETGGTGLYNDWTDIPLVGSTTATYYYRDSDRADNNNSILVYVTVTDSWNATINGNNTINVTTTTTIDKIEKVSSIGSPGTIPRDIGGKQQVGDASYLFFYDNTPMSVYVVATGITIGSRSFTLQPSSEWGQNTVYFRSATNGHFDDPTPSIYVDEMGMGLTFRNTLPPDYRPGKVWNSSDWLSHNRNGGASNVYNGSSWVEMRTINGASGADNPPFMRHSDSWKNQRLVGTE